MATVLAWFVLGEHLAAPQLFGGALVLLGALVAQTSRPSEPAATEPAPAPTEPSTTESCPAQP